MKGTSHLLAVLILVGVVVAAGIAGGILVYGYLAEQALKGNDLVVSGASWWWEERRNGGYNIYVHGILHNIGDKRINVTGVGIYQRC